MCSRLDLCQNKTHLPIPHVVLVASTVAGYPIKVGVMLSANITLVAQQTNTAYPHPNTITEYITDAKVEPRAYDTKLKSKKPFDWYSLMDLTNLKK